MIPAHEIRHPALVGNTGPLDWAELLFKATWNMSEWPEIGPLPHVGKIKCPPLVARLPRDVRGYPILFTLAQEEQKKTGRPTEANFQAIGGARIRACVEETLCGVCGKALFKVNVDERNRTAPTGIDGLDIVHPQRIYFIGGPASCERSYHFNDAPMHFCCAVFALRVCPWMILARYKRSEEKPEYLAYEGQILERPPKLGLVQAVGFDFDAEARLFVAKWPVLLGYVAPMGWPSDEAMKEYWARVERMRVKPHIELALQQYRRYMHATGNVPDLGKLITTGRHEFRPRTYTTPVADVPGQAQHDGEENAAQ